MVAQLSGVSMIVLTYEVTAQLSGVSMIVLTLSEDPFMMYTTPVFDPLENYLQS